jgi:hypothetical protein
LPSVGHSYVAPPSDRRAAAVAWGLCLTKILLHLALVGRYGYHRDELYFIACGEHLAFGYVDHPPLVPWIAALAGALFDHSLFGLRMVPALAGGATVLLTARVARELGGGWRAVLLACTSVLVAPAYLRTGKMLCIPSLEPLFWTSASLCVVWILRGRSPRWWLVVGLIAGVGLLNKHSMLLWIAGMGVGLVATRHRVALRSPFAWLGLAVALAILAPNLGWQVRHGWPTIEFLRGISSMLEQTVPRSLFVLGQVLYMHPLTLPIWLGGLIFAFRSEQHRPFGWLYVTAAAALIVTHGKPYYLAPAYPWLFAAGGVAFERWIGERTWAHRAAVATLIAGGVALAPFGLPILPVDRVDRLGDPLFGWIVDPQQLTRELHDEHGWPEQAAVVAAVYDGLEEEERDVALVLTGQYGQAGAIDFFGRRRGLPPAASGHLTYHHWGIAPGRGGVAIAYGLPREELEALYADVREVAVIDHPLAMPSERGLPVYVCRGPIVDLAQRWPAMGRYRRRTVPPRT